MTLKSAPYYWVECDVCEVSANAETDYAAWAEPGTAYDSATDGDWAVGIDGKDYCWKCSPFPMCAECGNKNARTEWDDDTFCDECIAIIAEDEDAKTVSDEATT